MDNAIEYSTHIETLGWRPWASDGEYSGTCGQGLRLEAIKIRLTGDMATTHDVYYRVHSQNFGWLHWAKNGAEAGTAAYGFRLEAIEIVLVEKDGTPPGLIDYPFREPEGTYTFDPYVKYRTHVQNFGWQSFANNGGMSGTSDQGMRLEAIEIAIEDEPASIEYRTHIQNIGWQDWVSDGAMSGTSGLGLRLEAIQIRLTGSLAATHDVYYRVHAQNFGWLGWAKDGESAGTAGYSYRLEAIEIVIIEKGGTLPGPTDTPFRQV